MYMKKYLLMFSFLLIKSNYVNTVTYGGSTDAPIITIRDQHSNVLNTQQQQEQHSRVKRNRRYGRYEVFDVEENEIVPQGSIECPPYFTGQHPYLLDCRQFLNCWKGRGTVQSCAPGTLFNPISRECDYPSKVKCQTNEGTYDQMLLNQKYVSNINSRFNSNDNRDYNSNTNNNNNHNRIECPKYTSGLFAHPYECNKFLNCDQGTVHIQECGPGTVFNPSLKVCDWPANVKCNTQNSGTTNVDHTDNDYGEGKLDIRISNEETDGTTYNQNRRYDLDSSATQNIHHGGYPGYQRGNTQNNYGDYNKKQHVNKVFYTLNNQTSSLIPPLPTTLPNVHNIKTSFKSNNQPATQSTNIPLISNSYSSVKTNQPLYISPINNNFNTSSSHPERIDDPTTPNYPRITPTNTTFESNKQNTSFDRLDEYIRLLNSYNEHGKFNLKSNQSQLSVSPQFPQNSINDTLTESLRLLNNYNNNNNITNNNNTFYNKQLEDNVHPIYFRQTTSSTTEIPSLSSFSQIKPISENSNAADTIKSDYNQQYHNLNKHISNKEPNLQTDYLPINDALKMLLRPYIHSNINNNTEQISNSAAKAMENQILNIVNNNEKIITNYTEPYEQKSLAKADFEDKYNIKINTVQTTTTTVRPTVIIRQPHPPYFPLHPTYFPSSYPPTHWSINHFNFNRLFPNHQQTIIDNKQLTSINYTKTNIEDHNVNMPQNDTEIIFSDYNPLRPTSPKPAMLPPTPQFHHSYEWHRTHNIPYPSMTKPNTNIDGNYHRNTDTEFIRSSEQDSLNEIPSSSSNKHNHNHNHNYHHHHNHHNHNHNFQHSSDWHKSHGIPMPSSNRDTNTEANHNFQHSSEWHKSHGIPMPSSNSNDDIETQTQKELIFTGIQSNNNNHQHHHNWDYLNINNNQQHNHGNRYHHNYHHNNNHHPNHYPISTTTDPTPNISPYFDFPSTTPSSFYYNRDRPTVPRNVLPLKTDNIGIPCDVGFNCQNDFCIPYNKVCDGKNNCGNRLDEQNCDHIGYEIRLSSDDIHSHMGRIEVKVYDKWGYVCDDKFGLNDANVLCRELGFPLGASEVRANSYYAANENMITNENDPIFIMDDVDCLGNETSLRECNFNGWGIHDCNKEEIVGVVCRVPTMKCPDDYWLCEGSEECIPTSFMCDNIPDCKDGNDELAIYCNAPIEYRLSGNEIDTEGRVEIKYHGIWGTICDDDFGNVEATVLCRSLGFGGPASLIKYTYGAGSGPIWLDQVSCIGNETSVDKCMHFEWGSHNCNHTEDVAVRCTRGSIEPITIETESSAEINANQYIMQMQRHSKVLDDNSNTCGQIKVSDVNDNYAENQYRVVSGKTAKQGHHPWQATIRAKDRNGKSAHWCGAVLISNIHLLTAAHCLNGFSKGAYLIRVGDHNSDILEDTEIEVFIENIYVHEDFRRGQHMNNDLALVLFKSRITFTNYIQPICLPTRDLDYTPGMNCTISGWGSIQYGKSTPSLELRAASVPIISDEVCRQSEVYGNAMMDGMFCAGFLNAESIDACEGDSGGPLVCENNGIHVLYGIISWGHRCGYANKPGVYVKISHYLDWIGDKIIQSIVNT